MLASHIFSKIQTVGSLNWPSPASYGTGRSVQNQLLDHLYVGSCVKLQAESVCFGEEIKMQPLFASGCCSVCFLGDVVWHCAILSDLCGVGRNFSSSIITSCTVDLKFIVLNVMVLQLLCWHIHTCIFMFIHQEAHSRLSSISVLLSPWCLMQSYAAFSPSVTLYFSFMSTPAQLFDFICSSSQLTTA